ncbi:MAG: antitoxin [Spirochaetes bacterium]|nr:MAG: antitoxin [Spirochaetota bacterium]
MAILQVRDIDDRIYETLKRISQQNKRSISQEVIHIIEMYLSDPQIVKRKNSTEEFLRLAGSWEDDRSAEEIIAEIRKRRSTNKRFSEKHGLFD